MGGQDGGAASWLATFVLHHPILAMMLAVAATILTTRLYTGVRLNLMLRKQKSSTATHEVPIIPYWIPWLGQALQFGLGAGEYLRSVADQLGSNSAIYCLIMGNTKHNVVVSPSIAKQILLDRSSPVSMDPLIYHTMEAFWDDQGIVRSMDHDVVFGPIHNALTGMIRQSFVDSAIPATRKLVEERISHLVSGATDPADQQSWETDGGLKIVQVASDSKPCVAEVSLHPFLRNFVGYIATDTLMGKAFLKNYPDILNDLWTMDSKFNAFMLKPPKWLPFMAPAVQARERIIDAVVDHHEALYKIMNGQEPDSKWGDMRDVSTVMVDRTREWRAANAKDRAIGGGDGAILWAMNVNANQVIFWLVWYIYSDAALLAEVRDEVATYVKQQNGKVDIDLDALWKKCPLLKGAFFETMRLEAAAMSYKIAEKDFVVSESVEDAKLLGKDQPESFYLAKGEFICIPHVLHQSDGRYFRDPQRFDPRRFWVHDADGKVDSVEYKTMKVWGGGKQMCKGKTFAEREVVLFAAAIITAWDMESVDGKWEHPGRKPTAGTVCPKKDVRVRMWKRVC